MLSYTRKATYPGVEHELPAVPLPREQLSQLSQDYQTLRLKKFPIRDDRLNLRLKLSILSWLQLFVIRTISRKIKACTRRCCLLPKIRESIKVYRDAAGLCKIATLDEIEAQGWSLNSGRYVGVAQRQEAEDFDESRTVAR